MAFTSHQFVTKNFSLSLKGNGQVTGISPCADVFSLANAKTSIVRLDEGIKRGSEPSP